MFKKICLLTLLFFTLPLFFYFTVGCRRPCEKQCHVIRQLKFTAIDNAGKFPTEIIKNEVYAKAMILRLDVSDSTKPDYCKNSFRPFLNPAYAIYAPCFNERKLTTAAGFTIFSDHDFDATHPAGTDMKDLFFFTDSVITSVSKQYDFFMLKDPDIEAIHSFTIKIYFPNTDTFTASTQPVKLLKQ